MGFVVSAPSAMLKVGQRISFRNVRLKRLLCIRFLRLVRRFKNAALYNSTFKSPLLMRRRRVVRGSKKLVQASRKLSLGKASQLSVKGNSNLFLPLFVSNRLTYLVFSFKTMSFFLVAAPQTVHEVYYPFDVNFSHILMEL